MWQKPPQVVNETKALRSKMLATSNGQPPHMHGMQSFVCVCASLRALGKSWQRNKISPSHNLHPWYKYHKQGGKCMACDKGPTDGQYCQYWRVLLSLGRFHPLRSWLIPAAQPCGSHPSQPSAARVCWHSPQILVLRCALYYWTGSWQPYSTQPIATSQLDFLQRLEILNSNLPVSFPTLQILSQMDTNGYIMLDSSIHPKAPYSESLLLPVELSRLEGFEIVSAFRLVPAQWCQ